MKKLSAFWVAVILACSVEALLRIIGSHFGGINPDGGGDPVGILLFLIHFPAAIMTMLLLHDADSPLWFRVEVGASILVFTLVFWMAIKLWRWYGKKRNAA